MDLEASVSPVQTWTKQDVVKLCVAVDIGGSGLRIRLSNVLVPTEVVDLGHVKAASISEVYSILGSIEQAISAIAPGFQSKGAAIAVAGPITNGEAIVTNWPVDISGRMIRLSDLPQVLFPETAAVLLNAFEAGAYGIFVMGEQHGLDPLFAQLWADVAPRGPILSNSRTAVLVMGSGLEVALIVQSPLLKHPLVVPTEFGHQQIPLVMDKNPGKAEEWELTQFISDFYYKGAKTPEYEDILSGRGLRLAYQFFAKKATGEIVNSDAAEIAHKAQEGDPVARQALTWHYKLFIRSAKDVAIAFTCDSVVLVLDDQIKNWWFVQQVADMLKDEFYSYTHPDWLNGIRVYVQTQFFNFNILGTDYIAHRLVAM
jgi:glucokinase